MRLEKDHGCRSGLTWRCDIHPGPLLDRLIDAFEANGFELSSETLGVANFDAMGARRHRVILVPTTGRLQLRLDYTTPHDEREAEAARLGTLLARILEEGDALPP